MKRIEGAAELDAVRSAFGKVFRNGDPFNRPFDPAIESRWLLFPVGFRLGQAELVALSRAAHLIGETEALVSEIEGLATNTWQDLHHWEIALDEEPYPGLLQSGFTGVIENAIYSKAGKWGLLISHEQHALVGGPADFIAAFKFQLRNRENQLELFLDHWKRNRNTVGSDLYWLPHLLEHVYGREPAAMALKRAGL